MPLSHLATAAAYIEPQVREMVTPYARHAVLGVVPPLDMGSVLGEIGPTLKSESAMPEHGGGDDRVVAALGALQQAMASQTTLITGSLGQVQGQLSTLQSNQHSNALINAEKLATLQAKVETAISKADEASKQSAEAHQLATATDKQAAVLDAKVIAFITGISLVSSIAGTLLTKAILGH